MISTLDWKTKIEVESLKTLLRDTICMFDSRVASDRPYKNMDIHILGYIKHIENDDKQNHIILAVRKAIKLTEEHLKL